MEDIINLVINNGLGVASFVALITYIFKYQTKANDTLDKINDSLISLNERVSNLENSNKEVK